MLTVWTHHASTQQETFDRGPAHSPRLFQFASFLMRHLQRQEQTAQTGRISLTVHWLSSNRRGKAARAYSPDEGELTQGSFFCVPSMRASESTSPSCVDFGGLKSALTPLISISPKSAAAPAKRREKGGEREIGIMIHVS
jgi:hypothetical protein